MHNKVLPGWPMDHILNSLVTNTIDKSFNTHLIDSQNSKSSFNLTNKQTKRILKEIQKLFMLCIFWISSKKKRHKKLSFIKCLNLCRLPSAYHLRRSFTFSVPRKSTALVYLCTYTHIIARLSDKLIYNVFQNALSVFLSLSVPIILSTFIYNYFLYWKTITERCYLVNKLAWMEPTNIDLYNIYTYRAYTLIKF